MGISKCIDIGPISFLAVCALDYAYNVMVIYKILEEKLIFIINRLYLYNLLKFTFNVRSVPPWNFFMAQSTYFLFKSHSAFFFYFYNKNK